MSHDLSGKCLACGKIFSRYPSFYPWLQLWFESLQGTYPEAHISCAGRGRIDQEALYARGASRAHYGQSAHNYNGAIDLFELRAGVYTLDPDWFKKVVAANLYGELRWYGEAGSIFSELPHVEVRAWSDLAHQGRMILVE